MEHIYMNDKNTQNNPQQEDRPEIAPNIEKRKAREKALNDEIEKQAKRYSEGQIIRFVNIRFPGNAKSFQFTIGKKEVTYGQKVVAMSDRGMAVGYVNSFPYEVGFNKNLLPIRNINKIATEEDLDKQMEHYRKQKEVETICNNLIEKYNLDMNLTHVEFTQFGKKTVFYFTAPQRVDFRGLVKDLVSKLKTRIELRQISLRDRAAAIGGIGPCGRQVCCSSFLIKYGKSNIKMAKNQNLNLNFSKLNGVCGQLKCCLQYEDDVYSAKRDILPREGQVIETLGGDIGRVDKILILEEQFDLITAEGVRKRYTCDQCDYKKKLSEKNIPRKFDHLTNETSTIIGMTEYNSNRKKKLQHEIEELKEPSANFAKEVCTPYFDKFTEENEKGKIFVKNNDSQQNDPEDE